MPACMCLLLLQYWSYRWSVHPLSSTKLHFTLTISISFQGFIVIWFMLTLLHGHNSHLWSLYRAVGGCIFMTAVPLWFLYCKGITAWQVEVEPPAIIYCGVLPRRHAAVIRTGGMQELNYTRNLVILQKNGLPCWIGLPMFRQWSSPFGKGCRSKWQKQVGGNKWKIPN